MSGRLSRELGALCRKQDFEMLGAGWGLETVGGHQPLPLQVPLVSSRLWSFMLCLSPCWLELHPISVDKDLLT